MQPKRSRVVPPAIARAAAVSLAIAAWALSGICWAQLEFSISPSPVGSGARAAAMSDAFVAIADDATAASWNPAGLIQLERPEISVVGSFNLVRDVFDAFEEPGAKGNHTSSTADLNFFSITYPAHLRAIERNITFSLSLQKKYDLERRFNLRLDRSIPELEIAGSLDYDFEQSGGLHTITPAIAFELTHTLSLGLAVNLWRDTPVSQVSWDQTVTLHSQSSIGSDPPEFTDRVTRDSYKHLRGENYSVGLLWQAHPAWTLGLRFDTSFESKVDFSTVTRGSNVVGGVFSFSETRKVHFPWTFAFGAAYRRNDRLTISGDLSTTNWNGFYYKDGEGTRFSLVDGAEMHEGRPFDQTWTIRLGTEYVFLPQTPKENINTLWTLRGGVSLDEEPASGRSTFEPNLPGDGKPDLFYGASIGAGVQLFNRVNLDAAYQVRYGNNVNSDLIRNLPGFAEDVLQHRFLLSAVIYF
jgi:long-subunit fatty acid transport protein